MDLAEKIVELEQMIKRLAAIFATACHMDIESVIAAIEGDVEKVKIKHMLTEDQFEKILDEADEAVVN